MKVLIAAIVFAITSVAQASCLGDFYAQNIQVPNQKLTRIGYGTLAVIGAGAVAAYTGGIGAFIPFFGATSGAVVSGVKISANDKRVKALRLVAEARGETAKYVKALPYFGSKKVIDAKSYFSAELNQKELAKAHAKMNKQYKKLYGRELAMNLFASTIVRGDNENAFCDSAKEFNSKNIMAYVSYELMGQ